MKLDADFRNALHTNLKLNRPLLEKSSLHLLSESIRSPFRTMLKQLSSKYGPFEIEFDSCMNCILDSLRDDNNPEFRLKRADEDFLENNEIEFHLVKPPYPHWTSPDEPEFRNATEKIEKEAENEFWEIAENIKSYEAISQFSPFNDAIIPIQYFNSYHKFIYNVPDWGAYIVALIKFHFPQFEVCTEAGKIVRFTKPLTPELSIGIEFDKGRFSAMTRADYPDISYLNIILYNRSFKTGMKTRPYLFKHQDDVLSMGILGNPFFYRPCFSLNSYAIVEMYDLVDQEIYGYAMQNRYSWTRNDHGDGTFSLTHPEVYGEKLKRHAYFYLAILAYSTSGYLAYLEKSILDSLQ
jgi:hypothetical protein